MDKKYSSCPLKKRPINVIKEEKETKLEIISDSTDTVPVDLTMHKFKTERIPENLYDEHYPINYSKVKPSELKLICTTEQQSHLHSTDNSRIQPPVRISTSYHYSPIHSPVESDRNSPHNSSPKDYSQSSIPLTNNYFEFDYQHQDYQNRNFNNNMMKHEIEEDYSDQINYPVDHGILSPPSSHFSYGSGHSDFGDYSEPEDLSIKNKRKVLVSTDSNANIQRDESERDLYYQCRICNKCYSTYAGLIKHQQCHSIPTELQSSSTYIHIHSSYLTQPTDNTLTSTNNDDKQVQATNNNRPFGAPRYQCKDCGKSYSTFSGLTKHQQFHCPYVEGNQAKKVFSCKNCDKVYVSLGALKMHIRTHTLPCKCPLCGKAFSRPWLLQGHIRTHTGEKPFTCQHCQRAFADRSNLRAHLQTHSEVKKYCCTSCTKTFSRMSLLSKHLQGGCNGTVTSSNDSNSTHLQMVQDHKMNNEDLYYNRNESDYIHRAKESNNYENHSYGGRIQNFE